MATHAPDTSAAEAYERELVPGLLAPWAEKMVDIAHPQPGEHVVDVACGTGIGARLAAVRSGAGGRVVGVDLDPAMIAVARRVTPAEHEISWYCASALELPLENAQFDLCLCLQGLQFFPDRPAALREMRRVLKPGGRLVACTWQAQETSVAHHALLQGLGRRGADLTAAARSFAWSDAAAIEGAAASAGFANVVVRTEQGFARFESVRAFVDACARGSVALRGTLAALPPQARDELVQEMEDQLAAYVGAGGLRWTLRANVLLASLSATRLRPFPD